MQARAGQNASKRNPKTFAIKNVIRKYPITRAIPNIVKIIGNAKIVLPKSLHARIPIAITIKIKYNISLYSSYLLLSTLTFT